MNSINRYLDYGLNCPLEGQLWPSSPTTGSLVHKISKNVKMSFKFIEIIKM